MRKKILPRKKSRSAKRVMFACAIFFVTLILLFAWYIFFQSRSQMLRPIFFAHASDSTTLTQLSNLLKKNHISYTSMGFMSDSSILIQLDDNENVIIATNKSLDAQIASLQLMIQRFTIEGRRFARLDFRFDKPIVSF